MAADETSNLVNGGTPSLGRLDDRYEVMDPTGLSMGVLPIPSIQTMIRQGRLFPTDRVSKNGGAPVTLADLPEFFSILGETLPAQFQVAGSIMRPRPETAGTLDATALAGVFAQLCQGGRTGRLFLADEAGRTQKVIIFQRGVAVNAMSNIAREQLGEVLIGHGLITAATFEAAVDVRRDQGGRLGSALITLEAMTPRQLHRALSLQAMERLLNAFRQQEGTFCFVPDDSAVDEEILLFASTRELVETGLHAALSAADIAAELAAFGESPVMARIDALSQPWGRALQQGDAEALQAVGAGKPLSQAVDDVARSVRMTTDEARLRILALVKYGLLSIGAPAAAGLDQALEKLQSQQFYDVLTVGRGATAAEVKAAFEQRTTDLHARPMPGDVAAVSRTREKIRQILDAAQRTLSHEDLRPMYDRALQLGLDFEQPEVRARLQAEHFQVRGKAAMTAQKYDEARRCFVQASEAMPEEPMPYVHAGWAGFLGSNRDINAAQGAVREVERALRIQGDLDAAHMTIGKIYRLAGVLDLAEKHLRHAIALNGHNNEAQSELRLIFTRELDGKSGTGKPKMQFTGGLIPTLVLYLVAAGGLFALANLVNGGFTEWPESVRPSGNYLIEVPKEIPADKQFFGLMEYYYLLGDPMWWIRRASLLLLGLAGARFIVRKTKGPALSVLGEKGNWVAAAIPYGILVGFLSPLNPTGENLGVTLGMTLVHVLAEQAFFIWFLYRALSREVREPWGAVGLTALAFGLYQLSFYAILNEPTRQMLLDVCQIGTFAGGAYAALYLLSGGLMAPLLAHVLVNVFMMLRTYLASHA